MWDKQSLDFGFSYACGISSGWLFWGIFKIFEGMFLKSIVVFFLNRETEVIPEENEDSLESTQWKFKSKHKWWCWAFGWRWKEKW